MVTITAIFKSDFRQVPEMYHDCFHPHYFQFNFHIHTATEQKPFRLQSAGHAYAACENSYCSIFHPRTFKFNSTPALISNRSLDLPNLNRCLKRVRFCSSLTYENSYSSSCLPSQSSRDQLHLPKGLMLRSCCTLAVQTRRHIVPVC